MQDLEALESELHETQEALQLSQAHERAFISFIIAGTDGQTSDVDEVLSDSSGSDDDYDEELANIMLEPKLPQSSGGLSITRTWGAQRSTLIRAFLVMVHPAGFGGPNARGSRRSMGRALGLSSVNFRSFVVTFEVGGYMKAAAVINLAQSEAEISSHLHYIVSHQRGAGQSMLAFLCAWLRVVGVTCLFSAADLTMPNSLNWHERNGFQRVSKISWKKAGAPI